MKTLHQNLSFPALALLLGAVGYRGFVSVEMARTDLDTVKRTLDYVAEVFQ